MKTMPLQEQSTRIRGLENEFKRLQAMGSEAAERHMKEMDEGSRDLLMKYSEMIKLQKRYDYMLKVRRTRVHTMKDFKHLKNDIERLKREIEES